MIQETVLKRLEKAGIRVEIDPYDLRQIAKAPPGIWVCNQLAPGLDEWILLYAMSQVVTEPRVLFPYPMPAPKGIKPHLVRLSKRKLSEQLPVMRFSKWLDPIVSAGASVGLVVDFSDSPIVSAAAGKNWFRRDVLRQLRKCRLPIIPVHLVAEHPVPSPLLRRTLGQLPFFSHPEPVQVRVRVGAPVLPEETELFEKQRSWNRFLQTNIFALGTAFAPSPDDFALPERNGQQQEPLAEPVDAELIAADMGQLPPECKVCARGQFEVYVANFAQIPNAMFEIARLRELTFRSVGEGSGKKRDLDEYDIYYLQLIIWDQKERRIVGGYRLGLGDQIIRRFGVNGLYANSLFKLRKGIFPVLRQAVELGRSYVTPEYQKHRLPLFLLWKGILHFLIAHPEYRYLYGPVSISKHYSDVSKGVIIEFVQKFFFNRELARYVSPRKPFRMKNRRVDVGLLAEQMKGQFENLEHFVEGIEPGHIQVPVLLRQYLKQNASFIAFNVDPLFSDCLDGLMLLDIRQLPEGTIEMLQQEK